MRDAMNEIGVNPRMRSGSPKAGAAAAEYSIAPRGDRRRDGAAYHR
jgi:hypothetical protein